MSSEDIYWILFYIFMALLAAIVVIALVWIMYYLKSKLKTLHLRHDQCWNDRQTASNPNITIYAPIWVKDCLEYLSQALGRQVFKYDKSWHNWLIINYSLTLRELIILARSEPSNVTGVINFENYGDLNREIVVALKDLVKHCVIVGKTKATHYGGYNCDQIEQPTDVYVCDLPALQFQQSYNTGRLVLLKSDEETVATLDEHIYRNTVGRPKPDYAYVANLFKETDKPNSVSDEFELIDEKIFFDVYAYKKFVAQDVLLSGLALNACAVADNDFLNFKFLKYGTGFFAGKYGWILEKHILDGVIDGLEMLLKKGVPQITNIELPFYEFNHSQNERLDNLCRNCDKTYCFSRDDALKNSVNNLVTATTNCSDPHAVMGNEMGYYSVDAAIAENLVNFGNEFSPHLNRQMRETFIDINQNVD